MDALPDDIWGVIVRGPNGWRINCPLSQVCRRLRAIVYDHYAGLILPPRADMPHRQFYFKILYAADTIVIRNIHDCKYFDMGLNGANYSLPNVCKKCDRTSGHTVPARLAVIVKIMLGKTKFDHAFAIKWPQ